MLTTLTLKRTGEVKEYIGEMSGKPVHISQWVNNGRVTVSEIQGYDLVNPVNYGKGTTNSYVPEEITKAMKEATDAYYAE